MVEKKENPHKLFYWRSPRAVGEIQRQIAASEYLIVYDLETTGFNPLCDRIIEFAAIRYRQTDGILEENRKLHKYFRLPNGMTLPDEVSKLTGITYEKLTKEPQEADCIEDILFFIEGDPLIGYNNLHFDDLFLKQLFYRNAVQYNPQKTFDVFHMAHDFVGEIENYKLETVAKFYGIKAKQYHSAFSDAEVTAELLAKFMQCFQNGETAVFCGNKKPGIQGIAYWGKEEQEEKDGRSKKRIYVNLADDSTKIFYDIESGIWLTTSNEVDMSYVEQQCWEMIGAKNEKEFRSFRSRKGRNTKAA